MKKIFSLGILLLVGFTALGPSQGQAFNSATHVYIAERVFPCTFDKINLYYGSIAPDVALYVDPPGSWPHAFCETHYKFLEVPYAWWNLTERAFANGWETHNEIWGADAYAHGTCKDYDNCVLCENCVSSENCVPNNCNDYCIYNGYVPKQADALGEAFEDLFESTILIDNPDLAHFAIEVAIDVLLARYHDPSLGLKLLWAARYRSGKDVDLMVSTFAPDQKIANALRVAEGFFQGLVIEYAKVLALPDPLRMVALGELGSKIADIYYGVSIGPAQVRWILRIAMCLCQIPNDMGLNYMDVIESTIWKIRTNPELIR